MIYNRPSSYPNQLFNKFACQLNFVPLYIAAITASMVAGALWRYRQRDMIGMAACGLRPAWASHCCFSEKTARCQGRQRASGTFLDHKPDTGLGSQASG